MKYKVLITTSGLGQRLGNITKYTNKALVKVGDKPAISYIVESYPKNVEFVVTLGYLSDQIKDFLSLAYPDRKFTFVNVKPFQGPGSSLGYSILSAKRYLQVPFIFHACDTLVFEPIPEPIIDWDGGYRGTESAQYRTFNVLDGSISRINEKGALYFDFVHIGLVGIKSYKKFWSSLSNLYLKNKNDQTLSDCHVIDKMIFSGSTFKHKQFKTWHDIGNVEGLKETKRYLDDCMPVLDKVDESIYLFDKFVIKFFYDKNSVVKRVKRATLLGKLVPKIQSTIGNFYKYKYVDGTTLSRVINPVNFLNFLNWSENNLWKPVVEVSDQEFEKVCYNFYYLKTLERTQKFLELNSIKDKEEIINGQKIPSVKSMLEKIDYKWLCKSKQFQFHGDFVADNVIKTSKSYCLIDWRQDFGGLLKAGDIYYDLAKLNHNFMVNHDIVSKGLFSVKFSKDKIECDILCKENLIECRKVFDEFLKNRNFDFAKVNILTALIWLNMSPLHEYPFNYFLYYFGKLNLFRALKEMNIYK